MKDEAKTFFISDLHFGHRNIIGYENRPFQTTDEMDEYIIKQWNKTVKNGDNVFLLGDISMYKYEKTKNIVNRLKGDITVVIGNHDNINHLKKTNRFELVSRYPILVEEFFLLSHQPIYVNEHCPFCNIHGHLHSLKYENTLLHVNVSVECINYIPIEFVQIKKMVKERLEIYEQKIRNNSTFRKK